MKIKRLALTGILTLTSFNIIAEESEQDRSDWYVGGMVGHGSVEIKSITHTNDQDNVTMVGAYGGYIFNDWFTLEVGLFSTGELADNQANLLEAGLSALTVTPKFTYEVSDTISFYGKAGIAHMRYEEEYNNYILYQRDYDQTWSGTGGLLGIGVQFSFENGIAVRLNYDRIMGSLDGIDEQYYSYAPDVDIDLEQLSISMHYHF